MINTVMLSVMAFVQNSVVYTVRKLREERGQDLLEYAILGGIVAAVGVAALAFLLDENPVELMFEGIGTCIDFDDGTDCNAGF